MLDGAGTTPLTLVEAKSAYTFDFASPQQASAQNYRARICKDLARLADVLKSCPASAAYALLLLTHPSAVPSPRAGAVKYTEGIRRGLRARSPDTLLETSDEAVHALFDGLAPHTSGVLPGGEAFGVGVVIRYHLLGPVMGV